MGKLALGLAGLVAVAALLPDLGAGEDALPACADGQRPPACQAQPQEPPQVFYYVFPPEVHSVCDEDCDVAASGGAAAAAGGSAGFLFANGFTAVGCGGVPNTVTILASPGCKVLVQPAAGQGSGTGGFVVASAPATLQCATTTNAVTLTSTPVCEISLVAYPAATRQGEEATLVATAPATLRCTTTATSVTFTSTPACEIGLFTYPAATRQGEQATLVVTTPATLRCTTAANSVTFTGTPACDADVMLFPALSTQISTGGNFVLAPGSLRCRGGSSPATATALPLCEAEEQPVVSANAGPAGFFAACNTTGGVTATASVRCQPLRASTPVLLVECHGQAESREPSKAAVCYLAGGTPAVAFVVDCGGGLAVTASATTCDVVLATPAGQLRLACSVEAPLGVTASAPPRIKCA